MLSATEETSTGPVSVELALRRAVLSERRGEARLKCAEAGLVLKEGDGRQDWGVRVRERTLFQWRTVQVFIN